jgi:hypothetical protein
MKHVRQHVAQRKVVWANKIIVTTVKFEESCLKTRLLKPLFNSRLPRTENLSYVEQAIVYRISCEMYTPYGGEAEYVRILTSISRRFYCVANCRVL